MNALIEKADEVRTYSACELEELAQEYGETGLAYNVVLLLANGNVIDAKCLATDFFEKIAGHLLDEERGAAKDMEAESYYNAYLGRKAA